MAFPRLVVLDGQCHSKRASHAGGALNTDDSTEKPGDFLCDSQSQAGSPVGAGRVGLIEPVENSFLLLLGHAYAIIGHREGDGFTASGQTDEDVPVGLTVPVGVADKIFQQPGK